MTSERVDLSDLLCRAERLLSHVWMVRTFLKHSPETEDDVEVSQIHRALYDVMLALGPAAAAGDYNSYFRLLKKKFRRLREAAESWQRLQPEVSSHMNFRMSVESLTAAVAELEQLLSRVDAAGGSEES